MTTMQRFGLDKLSSDERLDLISELWNSLSDEEREFPLTKEQEDDLNQRLNEDDADPNSGYSLEEVKARFRNDP
jgi:putative addiction module component (TIGR02574 family)